MNMAKLPKWLPVLVFLFCFPTMVGAQDLPLHVHEADGVTIKLMPGPCVNQTAQMIIAMNGLQGEFKHIDSTWRMRDGSYKEFPGCWAEEGDQFIVIFSDQTGGYVKKSDFKRMKGTTGI